MNRAPLAMRWCALHRSTRVAAAAGAIAALVAIGPVAFTVSMLRCCESTGPSAAARVFIALLVAVVMALAALVAGAATAALRTMLARRTTG